MELTRHWERFLASRREGSAPTKRPSRRLFVGILAATEAEI